MLDDPPDHPLSTDLLDLIDRLCLPPSRLDLMLDAGPVVDGGDVGRRALAALDLLGASSLGTVVLTSGAFPRTLDHLDAQPTRVIQRHDWQLYRSVRAARPESLNSVVYGDYSGEHAPERGGRGRGAGMEQQAQIIAQGGATPQQEDALVASLTQKLDRARRIWGDSASLSAAEVRAALDGPANRGNAGAEGLKPVGPVPWAVHGRAREYDGVRVWRSVSRSWRGTRSAPCQGG
ncbi:hypothetical protein ABZS86_28950 [Streptomyces sp. NPDC005355]|uniref:beta family protein n=1 Tax=Streptomyces sp. NPDC005355 TaxID=3157038 RepID=UPI0033B85637